MKVLKWIKEKSALQQIDGSLLIFLLLFVNVKLWIKVLTIIIICLINRKNLSKTLLIKNRLLLFYLSVILLTVINILVQIGYLSLPYLLAAGVGILFWLIAALASYLCFVYVEKYEAEKIHSTISMFFMINVLVTFITLGRIIIETGAFNPYTYQGMYQKYFIMTGDYMRGISFDTSTTNALLHAFGIVYFLDRRNGLAVLLCMAGLLLTGSNFTNLLLILTLIYLFIFQSSRDQKSLISICVFLLIIFSAKISPQNNDYALNTFRKIFQLKTKNIAKTNANVVEITTMPDSILNADDRKRKFAMLYLDSIETLKRERELLTVKTNIPDTKNAHLVSLESGESHKPAIPKDDIHSKPFQRNKAETPLQKELISFVKQEEKESKKVLLDSGATKLPGKLIAMKQTLNFLKDHPKKMITGDGTGNFSSKLAFRTTGLNIAGGYPSGFVYIHNDFRDNHLAVFLNYFSRDAGVHSVIHSPNSVYNQLLGEYGIAGMIAFLFLYVGQFIKKRKYLTYGIPLLLLTMGAFFIEYWFEQLSIVVVFELMLFLNIRENTVKDEVL